MFSSRQVNKQQMSIDQMSFEIIFCMKCMKSCITQIAMQNNYIATLKGYNFSHLKITRIASLCPPPSSDLRNETCLLKTFSSI